MSGRSIGGRAAAWPATRLRRPPSGTFEDSGWTILARNVRVGRSELDIVARDPSAPGVLVIVEVRSRSGPGFGAAVESVDRAKVRASLRGCLAAAAGGSTAGWPSAPACAAGASTCVTVERDDPSCPWRVTRHVRGIEPA